VRKPFFLFPQLHLVGLFLVSYFCTNRSLISFRKDHYAIKYLVRFITELYNANVVSEQSIRSLFRALVSVIGVGAPDIHQHIGDFLACTVMSALPLAGLPVADDESILSSLAHYMKKRTQLPLHVLKDQYGNQSDDWLERLYKSMLGHAKRKWPRLASVYSLHTNMDVRTKLEKLDSSAVDSVVFLAPDVENDDSLRELLLGGHTVSDPSTVRFTCLHFRYFRDTDTSDIDSYRST
jgi:hypothetical protein